EAGVVSTADKVRFVNMLSQTGVAEIEVSSFVSPKWVPQLGDASEVFAAIQRSAGVAYSALVPNEKGLEGAIKARIDKAAVFTAASETFSRKNTNASIAETIERFKPVVKGAKAAGMHVRGYVSCVVACPYEGPVKPQQVRIVAEQLLSIGVDEIDLGDTIGVAGPADIDKLYEGLNGLLSPDQTTLHLHDTRGTALACAFRAMQLGVRSFDSSAGGLGGCPYAPGAAGNLATEDLVYLCQRCGVKCGADLNRVVEASRFMASVLRRMPVSRVFQAITNSCR
ncbi:MAG TPA: hydroxymethylglutaryl-CoA lyase, partial [Phycisphaerales bacterium]|nr:hydroxymethylglutaryl-CoA lyase [Phycisphaerales bacterium]